MELIAPVRVVVVDDRQDHLFAIVNALAMSGIPCIWHLYDKESNQLLPKPPQDGYRDIRLVITDLNIRNFTGQDVDAKGLGAILLSDVLLPILPKSPVPYGLVLWSSVSGVVDEVRSFINERIDHQRSEAVDRRSRPLSIELMKKGEFISNLAPDSVDILKLMTEASKGVAEIRAQLKKALSDPQLRLICAWETRVSQSATATINTLYEVADLHSRGDENLPPTSALRIILAKLASEAAGTKNAAEDSARALDEGLIDLFVDDLRSTDGNEDYSALVKESLLEAINNRTSPSRVARLQLNTSLHVETDVDAHGKSISRGLVLGSDDDNQLAMRLGKEEARKVLWSEFLFPVSKFKAVAEAAAANKSEGWDELGKLYERAKADKSDVEKECRIRLLEVGADCDHANRKDRTIRLLCALEVPERFQYFMTQPGKDFGYRFDSLVKLGPWALREEPDGVLLLVSVGRFVIEQGWPLPLGLKPQYRLRRPIVDVVLRQYANYSSRLGYVAITE